MVVKKPSDLRTGMFGIDCDNDPFVVVGDTIVFEGGQYTHISNLDDDFCWDSGRGQIKKIVECYCFRQVKDENYDVLWEPHPSNEMTIAEIEEKLGIKNLKIIGEDD